MTFLLCVFLVQFFSSTKFDLQCFYFQTLGTIIKLSTIIFGDFPSKHLEILRSFSYFFVTDKFQYVQKIKKVFTFFELF